jgi:hypothetical protein
VIEHAAVDDSFADALADLREGGSAVLVCGTPPEETTTRMCRRLLGQCGDRSHDRLLVATEPAAARRLAPDVPGRTELVEGVTFARSAAAGPASASVDPNAESGASKAASVEYTAVEGETLTALGVAVSDRLTALAGESDPDGLRFGVESLDPLLASHPPRAVFRFVHLLAGQVRSAGGMLHAHLGAEREHEHARLLSPVFDAVVELRRASGSDQHRWRLPDRGRSTAWLALEDTQTGE